MRFGTSVILTVSTRILNIGLGLANSILLARYLGPSGRGIVASTYALVNVAIQLGNLGMQTANVYALAQSPARLRTLVTNSLWLAALPGVLIAIVLFGGTYVWFPSLTRDIAVPLLVVAVFACPVKLANLSLSTLAITSGRIGAYNAIDVFNTASSLVRTTLIFLVWHADIYVWLAAEVGFDLVTMVLYLRHTIWPGLWPNMPLLVSNIRYGIKAHISSLASFLVIQADVLLVKAFLGIAATGRYSLASNLASYLLLVPAVVHQMLFPKVSTEGDLDGALTSKTARQMVAFLALACVGAALVAPYAIPFLYTESFRDSVPSFLILLPGILALGVEMVLMSNVAARGFPAFAAWCWVGGLAVNIAMNVVLIPIMGHPGAALSSTVAYILMLAAISHIFSRISGRPVADFLLPHRQDLVEVVQMVQRRLARSA